MKITKKNSKLDRVSWTQCAVNGLINLLMQIHIFCLVCVWKKKINMVFNVRKWLLLFFSTHTNDYFLCCRLCTRLFVCRVVAKSHGPLLEHDRLAYRFSTALSITYSAFKGAVLRARGGQHHTLAINHSIFRFPFISESVSGYSARVQGHGSEERKRKEKREKSESGWCEQWPLTHGHKYPH